MVKRYALIAFVLASVLARSARADEPPEALALAGGFATLMVPFGISAALMAQPGQLEDPRTAVFLATAGMTLAPLLSHAIVGEWGRGAAFAVTPLAFSLAIVAITEVRPDVVYAGTKFTRVTWGTLLALALFSSSIGVIDCTFAPERTMPSVTLLPVFGPRLAGLSLEGTL